MPGSGGAPRREEVDDGDGETRPVGVRVPDGRGTTGVAILISTMLCRARDATAARSFHVGRGGRRGLSASLAKVRGAPVVLLCPSCAQTPPAGRSTAIRVSTPCSKPRTSQEGCRDPCRLPRRPQALSLADIPGYTRRVRVRVRLTVGSRLRLRLRLRLRATVRA